MSYDPDPGARASGILFTRQLSERDLSLQIPVNFVTAPGVVLTQACFAHKRYEENAAAKCFSNLLAIGFQRFDLDIYWDATRQVWSLCPVQLGTPIAGTNLTARWVSQNNPDLISELDGTVDDGHHRVLFSRDRHVGNRREVRQDSSSPGTSSTGSVQSEATGTKLTGSSLTTSKSTSTLSTAPASAPTASNGVVDIGPFSCSQSTSFQVFVNILLLHLEKSQTNVNATIKYLILNLHAAADASDPTGPSMEPPLGTLPQGKQALGYILDLSMAQYLYQPADLAEQRSDLNGSQSWYAVDRDDEPDSAYFDVHSANNGDSYTPDGWPSTSFVMMQRAKRLFAGFGKIEPQMEQYNFSADRSIIFPTGYLQAPITADPHLQGGSQCFFAPKEMSVSATNNSWALAYEENTTPQVFTAADNYLNCGISPVLNKTLQGVTADQQFDPYQDFLNHTIWSWAPNEPQHAFGGSASKTAHRCAVLSAGSGYWATNDCSNSHYSACHDGEQPYRWDIGKTSTSYTKADIPCPGGTVFLAPRTALENNYLLHHWRQAKRERNIDDDLLWLNFNDLDVEGCWVVGQNVTCPYVNSGNGDRDIIVPVIAAIIVFVLAALTVFVKCAANRRQSRRRRRRGDDGWDYEGVPS